jgi:hypothetical protein
LVGSLEKLNSYPWSGHSALMGLVPRKWQEKEAILACFSSDLNTARNGYSSFVREGIAQGRRPELVGGGLIRSLGDWSQVISQRRRGETISSDARILGGSGFVDRILTEAEKQETQTLRFIARKCDLPTLLKKVAGKERIDAGIIASGVRKREVVRARKLFSQVAVHRMGYTGAEVARFLGLTTSAVNRLASQQELQECDEYTR